MTSNPTPTFGDTVSYTKPFLAKGDAPKWRVRYVDTDGTLTLDLLGGRRGRSTARFGVDPGKVTVRPRETPEQAAAPLKRDVNEDDKTVSAAVAPVQEPKFEVMSADFHRNGVGGRGFYVGIVKHRGDSGEGEEPRLLQIVALPSEDGTATDDLAKMSFDNGYGVEIYVTDLMTVAKRGTVAFGINSFRGDNFIAEAVAIIRQTRQQWDNQMLTVGR